MNLKRTALVLIMGAASYGAITATANAQPVQQPAAQQLAKHPARQGVLARVHQQRQEIRTAERNGKITPMKARRLLAVDRHIARQAHMRARLARLEHRRLERVEQRIQHSVKS